MSKRGLTPALDRLTTAELGQLLSELLLAHPELVDQAENRALALLAVADADEVAESIEWTLREADADQLACRSGRVYGRGYVHENEAASEILGELLQPDLDDLARRAALGLYDAASQIGLGLLLGLAACRTAVADGNNNNNNDDDATHHHDNNASAHYHDHGTATDHRRPEWVYAALRRGDML